MFVFFDQQDNVNILRNQDDSLHVFRFNDHLVNAYKNRIGRIQSDTRPEKVKSYQNSYQTFEKRMMYVVAMAIFEKAKNWSEDVCFTPIENSSKSDNLKHVFEKCAERNNLRVKFETSNSGVLSKEYEKYCYDYEDLIDIAYRIDPNLQKRVPFTPHNYRSSHWDRESNCYVEELYRNAKEKQ